MSGWWKNQGLNFKVALGISVTMVVVLGFAFWGVSQYIRNRLWENEIQKLENINAIANTMIADSMMAGQKDAIDDAINKVGQSVTSRQLVSISVYDDEAVLTAFASGFAGGIRFHAQNMPRNVEDPTCWGCHVLVPEMRPSHIIVEVEGKQVIRNSVALYNEARCQSCHGTGLGVLGDVIVDYSMDQYEQSYNTIMFGIGGGIVLAIGFVILALYQSIRRIVLNPITVMADTFEKGSLETTIPVQSGDEIGVLAKAFNSMSTQLRELIGNLEERIADRTRALETSAAVSSRLSTIVDQQELLVAVVEEVQRAFGYYHAHIYLLEEGRDHLVMAGGTGQPAQIMLQRGHMVAIGKGLVGRAAETKTVILSPDTYQDEKWLPNPLLPETRSEIAIPILAGEQVLGILDVQHNIANGLGEQDAQLLQSIANQVAIAIQNARVYRMSQQQAEKETLINMIGRKIQTASTVEDVLQIALEELSHALAASKAEIEIGLPKNGGSEQKSASTNL